MTTIVIIGAGFSGTVSAVQLMRRNCGGPLHVILVNRSGPMARGIAYGTQSQHHLLNVPAGNMSALADDPDHFLRYCRRTDPAVEAGSFVSRRLYGDYLECLLNETEAAARPQSRLTRLVGEAIAVVPLAAGAVRVSFSDGSCCQADRVLLAFGHYPARNPAVTTPAFYASRRYIRDPWQPGAFDRIGRADAILLLGTGLTTVDVATQLLGAEPGRTAYALSRRGLIPQPHRSHRGPPAPSQAPLVLAGMAPGVRALLRGLRAQIRGSAAQGHDWREVIGALRPFTRAWWEALPHQERSRFLRHLQPFWDIHRHRVAPAAFARFQAAIDAGQLRLRAARVAAYRETADGVAVTYLPRGAAEARTVQVAHVINCTGPESDLRRVDDALLRQLFADGLIQADALGLGIAVAADNAVLDARGRSSARIFYVGPLLKACYWEATAVPELRVFALQFADTVLRAASLQTTSP